jgi:hypothetical protein
VRRYRQDSIHREMHMTQKTKPPTGDPQGRQGGKTGQAEPAKGGGQQKPERSQGPAKNADHGKK